MKNITIVYIGIFVVALFMQSCEKMTYSDPTHMEDYLAAPEFTPDLVQDKDDMIEWERLEGDGESGYFPYIYQITDKPGSMIYRKDYGIRFDAYGGWWDQRTVRTGFEVNGDFEIEFKMRIVEGTGDAVWQKAGIIVGDVGGDPAKLWLSLENPIDPDLGRINRFIPGASPKWFQIDKGNFSVFDWQVIKAVRTGNTLKIFRNGTEVDSYTNDLVANINGKVGLSAEALSADYEYIMVNGVKDDFTDMDNWENLDKTAVIPPSEWTVTEESLNVVARYGLNHRAMWDAVPENFTTEFKIKIDNPNSSSPKAGILVGELGDGVPECYVGLDFEGDNNSVVKYINGKSVIKLKSPAGEFSVKNWHTIRVSKLQDELFLYLDGVRIHFEKGSHITNIQGKLGVFVEGCEADFESVSVKEEY